jgi:AraC-like DNA-binding protein
VLRRLANQEADAAVAIARNTWTNRGQASVGSMEFEVKVVRELSSQPLSCRLSTEADRRALAQRLGVDSRTFLFTVNRELGMSLIDARRAIVMRRAVQGLLATTTHVRQIAFSIGYTDAGNFSHDFRRFFGLTPSRFRKLAVAARTRR